VLVYMTARKFWYDGVSNIAGIEGATA